MRTTLDIDDDILAAAKERGRLENKTAGQVISDLARAALTTPAQAVTGFHEDAAPFDGCDWPLLPRRSGRVVTNELVKRIEHELDLEVAGLKAAPTPPAPAAARRSAKRR